MNQPFCRHVRLSLWLKWDVLCRFQLFLFHTRCSLLRR
jgi:hypothetical protein